MRGELRERLARSFTTPGSMAPPPERPGHLGAATGAFEATFLRKAERVVTPAMLEVGRLVERHGRFFSIELLSGRTTCRGIVLPTSVQMNFFRRSRTVNFKNECPHFNVSCDAGERKILFHYTIPSHAGEQVTPCGRSTLEQLGRDLVQERLVASLHAILGA